MPSRFLDRTSEVTTEETAETAKAEDFSEVQASDYGSWDPPPYLEYNYWGNEDLEEEETPPSGGRTKRGRSIPWLSWLREPFCGLSHLLGAAASLVALLLLLRLAAGHPPSVILSAALYGSSLVALYTASGLYHSLKGTAHTIAFLQRLDFSAIFLLIAGTFAPLCLITLRGPKGWSLLAVEYVLALVGIALVLFRFPLPAALRVGTYLGMGWLSVVVFPGLLAALGVAGVVWYVSGGLLYSLGTIVLATDRPHLWPGRFSAHDLWHLFVLAGSACHFVLIYSYIMPPIRLAA
jgi:hemolysin III